MILEKNYGNFRIYFNASLNQTQLILNKLLKREFIREKILKKKENRKVILIRIEGKRYVLKREKGRKVLDRFLKSKARITIENVVKLKKKGFNKLPNVKLAIERRRGRRVMETFLLTEYIEGETPQTIEEYQEVMKTLAELHSLGHYHGDCKPENFISTSQGIILVDSKFRKSSFFILGKCKDILRFQRKTARALSIGSDFKRYKWSPAYYLAILLIYKKKILNKKNLLRFF